MNAEQTEAFLLDKLQTCRLFSALGQGDFLLPEAVLLEVIHTAHQAGALWQTEKVMRRFDELVEESTP